VSVVTMPSNRALLHIEVWIVLGVVVLAVLLLVNRGLQRRNARQRQLARRSFHDPDAARIPAGFFPDQAAAESFTFTAPPPIAGWLADPTDPAHRLRYWDGAHWTEHVAVRSDAGGTGRATGRATGRR